MLVDAPIWGSRNNWRLQPLTQREKQDAKSILRHANALVF